MPAAFLLSGQLDVAALEQSLNEIIKRHEALRTVFVSLRGRSQPAQKIAAAQSLKLALEDLRALPECEREAEARRLVVEESQRPFDLAAGPLIRAGLIRLGEQDFVLWATTHHIVSDGWSVGVMLHELAALYKAYSGGGASPLADLPIQYADFAIWQRGWLAGDALAAELSFWKEKLGGELSPLQLPTDRPRPAVQTYRGASQSLELSRTLTGALKALGRAERATLFMMLAAALNALLYRYTGQNDIVIGTPVASRNHVELEKLIGFFVNTLVLRTDLEGDPSFFELIERVRKESLLAFSHQDAPFEKIVEALQPERMLSQSPIFQVAFILQNTPVQELKMEDLTLTRWELESNTAKFDLTFSMEEVGDRLVGSVEYNTDLFDHSTIGRMIGHFQVLLEGIVESPESRLSELPLLTEAEQHQLLREWNDTTRGYCQGLCVHELFEAQVERTPDAAAVVFGNERVSYRELNERANRLASYLRGRGVGPEICVGLCLERSPAMVTAMLGVLKAGGAYVPLDPAYPKERLTYMLEDSQAAVLLTERRLLDRFELSLATPVCVDAEQEKIADERAENLTGGAVAQNLAYVIYTSGSTGKPKGVAIEHRSTVTMLRWAGEVLPHENYAGVLASTSICFDLSVYELFVPLSVGGTVILAENALQLPALPAAEEVTLINTVPSAMAELVRINGVPGSVRVVNLAGEPLQGTLVERVYGLATVEQVFNLYGPSEDTTYSTYTAIERRAAHSPTIGRPVSDTQVYLLDRHLRPVPVGVTGELYLAGAGLARCYFNRPGQTAERFISNPFSGEPGARMYRTGDLARYLPDGQIDFLGRGDRQIKLRGFRIELGEIEESLYKHPDVRDAVVVVYADASRNQRLVAYVVTREDRCPDAGQLRGFIKQSLPDYMVPASFVFLDAMPLTPNRKVNRHALPAPDVTRTETKEALTTARTPTEEALAAIWSEILGIGRIGVDENFFELGGHSLLATQVISRVQEVLGAELPVLSLFESPTIASLAEVVEQKQVEGLDDQRLAELLAELNELSEGETLLLLASGEETVVRFIEEPVRGQTPTPFATASAGGRAQA
jgi:amino acid adenylation domain-containing protein